MMLDEINGYLTDVSDLVRRVDSNSVARVLEVIYDAYQNEKTIFIFGNGGGAATASHLVCDLAKGTVVGTQAAPGGFAFR